MTDEPERIPFWRDSEDRDRGADPDYYLTPAELAALADDPGDAESSE